MWSGVRRTCWAFRRATGIDLKHRVAEQQAGSPKGASNTADAAM